MCHAGIERNMYKKVFGDIFDHIIDLFDFF